MEVDAPFKVVHDVGLAFHYRQAFTVPHALFVWGLFTRLIWGSCTCELVEGNPSCGVALVVRQAPVQHEVWSHDVVQLRQVVSRLRGILPPLLTNRVLYGESEVESIHVL